MKTLASALTLCSVLAACGGGSGSDPAPVPPPTPTNPVPAATLSLTTQTMRTIAGGPRVSVAALQSGTGTVTWKLAEGSPGTLSATTGTSIWYTPPASGITGQTTVTLNASADGASAALTLLVTPDPGAAGLYFVAGHTDPSSNDGAGAEASFPYARKLAADGAGNLYVLQHYSRSPSLPTPPILRKVTPDARATTLPGTNYGNRLSYPTGFAADRAGNLYVSSAVGFGVVDKSSPPAAILKITPAGDVSLLAGSEEQHTGAMTDGTGAAARFLQPAIVGIDNDGNLYVRDANDTPRKVTPAGVVTTLKTFPSGLNADLNGNTYSFDAATKTLLRISPTGAGGVVAGAPACTDFVPGPLPACLGGAVADIIPTGGASYALLTGPGVVRLVLPH